MHDEMEVNLGNLLLSLADAMELANPAMASHSIRVAFIAWEVARCAEMQAGDIEDVFIAALLHDLGALSVEEKARLHEEELNTEAHCIKGAWLLSRVGFLHHLAPLVLHHHDQYNTHARFERTVQSRLAQIIHLADKVERAVNRGTYILHQYDRLRDMAKGQAGKALDPQVVDVFMTVSTREDFWLDLESPRLYSLLLRRGPCRGQAQQVTIPELKQVSELFRDIIDFRSRFTATHSFGVARSAKLIAKALDLSEFEVELMEVAGNVHDLGKLALPNAVLEKPEELSEAEYWLVKKHVYLTYTVLSTIGGLRQLPEWAGFHHERLDGTGYPFHLGQERLDTGARIMAVADVFTALEEDRPYRKGLRSDKIVATLAQMATENKLDGKIVQILVDSIEKIREEVDEQRADLRDFYDSQFTSLPTFAETEGNLG